LKSASMMEETEKLIEIPSIPYETESEFIQKGHHFYNQTVGWGKIKSLNWQEQQQYSQLLLDSLDAIEEKESLTIDFNYINSLATFIIEKDKDKDHVILLHRIFHDLDMDVNKYENDDYFEVTNYGEGKKQKEIVKHIKSNTGA
jgi:hypothetical protein